MTSEYKKQDKLLILKITEEIDHHTSEKIRKRADYEIQIHIPKKVIFDFENVTFMDSSGIGFIIGRFSQIRKRNGKIVICSMNEIISRIVALSGLKKICMIASNEQEAENYLEVA